MAIGVVAAVQQLCLDLDPEPEPWGRTRTGTVLLVGPTESARIRITRGFEEQGFQVLVARGVRDALDLVAEHDVSLVITGGGRSRRAGLSVLARLRGSDVPVVWLGCGDDDEAVILRKGASLFFRSPAPVEQLVTTALFATNG